MSVTVNNNSWWAEKYRPMTLDEYSGNDDLMAYIKPAIEKSDINHLLFHNEKSGSGKTTLAKIIANTLDADVMYINASDENSVETVRERIKNFASTIGFSQWKIIILDEFSYFSLNAQSALNSMMEQFSKKTRFIITCNYIEKVLPSIRSRCTMFHLTAPPVKMVAKRCQDILNNEGVKFDLRILGSIVKKYYPDQRTILNELQKCSITGELKLSESNNFSNEYVENIFNVLMEKGKKTSEKYKEIRQIIADSRIKTFEDIFRFLFENVYKISNKSVGSIILTLAKYQHMDMVVLDKEININACIIEILTILNDE